MLTVLGALSGGQNFGNLHVLLRKTGTFAKLNYIKHIVQVVVFKRLPGTNSKHKLYAEVRQHLGGGSFQLRNLSLQIGPAAGNPGPTYDLQVSI